MKLLTHLFIVCCISILVSSCADSAGKFTVDKLMTVHQGMSSDEILELFGKPESIDISVCGKDPKQWTCTTWEYRDFIFGKEIEFVFSGSPNALKLNNVHTRKY